MRVYIAHSKTMDYMKDLYKPSKKYGNMNKLEMFFPHENNIENYNTREFYKTFDCIIAEVSYPSTGLGIELGWAYDDKIPIYCLHKKGKKVSSSIKVITDKIYEYSNEFEMIEIIDKITH